MCGERAGAQSRIAPRRGSSPRVWGTGNYTVCRAGEPRFIPTCVGNGSRTSSWCPRWTVHPHVCGERAPKAQAEPGSPGSSPRVWGTGNISIALHECVWFIPTCVGNGIIPEESRIVVAVHPHVCGERPVSGNFATILGGSSPRVWGTVVARVFRLRVARFIPTCVGNGGEAPSESMANSVHPHVCGERVALRSVVGTDIGSSPRVWGTGLRPARARAARRFIPTCVGNGCSV